MILSKVMRNADYSDLFAEGQLIVDIQKAIDMWHAGQHPHRIWEYAMAQRALTTHFGVRKGLKVADHGCGGGYLSPILYWLGHDVRMYECWTFGNEERFMMEQMSRVTAKRLVHDSGDYKMYNRPLSQLTDDDRGIDAAFCISTLEHIGGYQWAFRDLLSTVRKGGLVFLTTDFGEHEKDDYAFSNLRAGKMFTARTYLELQDIAASARFSILGHQTDYLWSEECRLVNGYGFASLALVKD